MFGLKHSHIQRERPAWEREGDVRGFGDALYIYSFEIMILVHVKAKSLLCYWAVRDLSIGMAQIARRLNLSLVGVSQSVKRGETIVQQKGYNLIDP